MDYTVIDPAEVEQAVYSTKHAELDQLVLATELDKVRIRFCMLVRQWAEVEEDPDLIQAAEIMNKQNLDATAAFNSVTDLLGTVPDYTTQRKDWLARYVEHLETEYAGHEAVINVSRLLRDANQIEASEIEQIQIEGVHQVAKDMLDAM